MRKTPLKRLSQLKRSPLRRTIGLKQSSPLRQGKHGLVRKKRMKQVSKKREGENKEYSKLRKQFLKDHPWCRVCQDLGMSAGTFTYDYPGGRIILPIGRKATEVHHQGRRNGKWLTDVRFFLPVCRAHHDYIEKHGDWARQRGYLLSPEDRRSAT